MVYLHGRHFSQLLIMPVNKNFANPVSKQYQDIALENPEATISKD